MSKTYFEIRAECIRDLDRERREFLAGIESHIRSILYKTFRQNPNRTEITIMYAPATTEDPRFQSAIEEVVEHLGEGVGIVSILRSRGAVNLSFSPPKE